MNISDLIRMTEDNSKYMNVLCFIGINEQFAYLLFLKISDDLIWMRLRMKSWGAGTLV